MTHICILPEKNLSFLEFHFLGHMLSICQWIVHFEVHLSSPFSVVHPCTNPFHIAVRYYYWESKSMTGSSNFNQLNCFTGGSENMLQMRSAVESVV